MSKDNWFHVSYSKVKLWRKCRQAYWFRYVEKLRRKRTVRPLQFGRMVHEMIEAFADGKDPFKHLALVSKRDDKMFRSQHEEYGDIVNDVRIIMKEYFTFWETAAERYRIKYVQIGKKRSEHSFSVQIDDGILMEGKLDGIVEANKLRWLGEHKSGKQPNGPEHGWRNLQSGLYIRINDMLKLPPLDGTMWDFIRSKAPTRPQMKKDGTLSARALDTLPLAVAETFKELKLNINDRKYAPLVKLSEANRKTYFTRVFTPFKKHVVDVLYDDFVSTAREMATMHGKDSALAMNIDRHCEWCDYEPLCRAILQDSDVGFIKKKEYTKNKKYQREDADLEA